MRHDTTLLILTLGLIGLGACAPELMNPGGSVIDTVAGITDAPQTDKPGETSSDSGDNASPSPPESETPTQVDGSVTENGDYRLYELGPCAAGDAWRITAGGTFLSQGTFLVTLFDADHDLLRRELVSSTRVLEHVVRDDTTVYLGVAIPFGRAGGSFRFNVSRTIGNIVPAPAQQVVYLNFAGGSDINVHRRSGLDFPAFDASRVGSEYAGLTAEMKTAIVDAMYDDYADFGLTIVTSDEGPMPPGACSVLHFGGNDGSLLGLADSVDQYNTDGNDAAIIYVEAFSNYTVMQLSAEEMGQMIGNVASHELGHLLGLFHTKVPTDIMDTTGTAWDLATNQSFERGVLEDTVFPMGYENSPARLAETIGRVENSDKPVAKPILTEKMYRKAVLKAIVHEDMHCLCGTCLHLDD